MSFTYHDVANTEFGVCRGPLVEGDCVRIPIDNAVKGILQQMVLATRQGVASDIAAYEPSQEYSSDSQATLPLNDALASRLLAFYRRDNLPIDADALKEPQSVSSYFCVLYDAAGNKLVAFRRASQFKAVLKAHLLRFMDDGLRAINDNVFKLDSDFDFYIADDVVRILRIAGFEQIADVDEEVQKAAVENTKRLETLMPSLGFASLAVYVAKHKRAARIVAALLARQDLCSTSVTNLKRECKRSGVAVQTNDGKLCPAPGSEMGFLQMLDRRRYSVSLIQGRWEQYEAGSRKGVGIRERQGLRSYAEESQTASG